MSNADDQVTRLCSIVNTKQTQQYQLYPANVERLNVLTITSVERSINFPCLIKL